MGPQISRTSQTGDFKAEDTANTILSLKSALSGDVQELPTPAPPARQGGSWRFLVAETRAGQPPAYPPQVFMFTA